MLTDIVACASSQDGIDIPDPKHKGSTIKICKGVYLEIEPGEIEAKTASTGETFKTRASQKETWVVRCDSVVRAHPNGRLVLGREMGMVHTEVYGAQVRRKTPAD